MTNHALGLLGTKIGMTQLFEEGGTVLPVTVVALGPCRVLQVKTADTADGYHALQLGFGEQKPQRLTKPFTGHASKTGETLPRYVREIRVDAGATAAHPAGSVIVASDIFATGDFVDAIGTSKGRGFAGVMKRHNFRGSQTMSHGTHEYFRHGGSIGTRLTPGMTLKGTKMPGQMGNSQTTVQNIKLVKIDAERNLVYLLGSVPGPKGGLVKIRKAVKKA